jgi:methylenetetrahydrofolate reductase (NADPH)
MSRALRPLFVNVTWGAGGSTAARSLELAELCQRQLGLTTCLHLTCTNMNKSLVDEALDDAKALGIRNILALRGDPPMNDEYREEPTGDLAGDMEFTWAVDLVRYIRERHGDYFCVGVAAYPEGHADESYPEIQSPSHDLPYLIEKTVAGADFIMTQLFFDVKAYLDFEKLLRSHPSGVFKNIPLIPGLMPIQSYAILRRTTKLSHAKLPEEVLARLETAKGDDEAVKKVGVDIVSEIVEKIKDTPSPGPRGFHFYTLNLEKAVAFILERCSLIPLSTPASSSPIESVVVEDTDDYLLPNGANGLNNEVRMAMRRRLSSVNSDPHNLVIVDSLAGSGARIFEAPADEAGIPKESVNTRANTLAISEGQGSLGREATWDDYPNGRWGDARSPGEPIYLASY